MSTLPVLTLTPRRAARSSMPWCATLLAASMIGCSTPAPNPTPPAAAPSLEDIYVLRSVREERNPTSAWCTPERTGLAVLASGFMLEDRYTMWSVSTESRNGRIVDAKANVAGELHACFGATADPKLIGFFTEGRIAGQSFSAKGDCIVARTDFPEKGISTLRCYLALSGLPAPYVGGSLATNTIGTKLLLGGETDPPGYVQASIATVRLWRAR